MGIATVIQWTVHTFNPWIGCTKISRACKLCYAALLAGRYWKVKWGPKGDRRPVAESTWKNPYKWNRKAKKEGHRALTFCASLADVFEDHPAVVEYRERLWRVIEEAPYLEWQLLTKRPENIARFLPPHWIEEPRDNVWLGTTVESPELYQRIEDLIAVPAKCHFLSIEPIVEDMPNLPLKDIEWVIVGGESGAGYQAADIDHIRSVRDQCVEQDVRFFFKQWGTTSPKKAGRELDGREWSEFPDCWDPKAIPAAVKPTPLPTIDWDRISTRVAQPSMYDYAIKARTRRTGESS